MKKVLKKIGKGRAAETILEVVIAVAVLMIVIGPAAGLLISSVKTTAMSRNDLIGAALAEEGIEIMRNFRDSNLLKFSPDALRCWNARAYETDLPDPISIDNCWDPGRKMGDESSRISSSHILTLDFDEAVMNWGLADYPLAPVSNAVYRLRLDAFKSDESNEEEVELPNCRSITGSEACSYGTGLYFSPPGGVSAIGVESPFYRKVSIKYLSLFEMQVDVDVWYVRGSDDRHIIRSVILTNTAT